MPSLSAATHRMLPHCHRHHQQPHPQTKAWSVMPVTPQMPLTIILGRRTIQRAVACRKFLGDHHTRKAHVTGWRHALAGQAALQIVERNAEP